MASYELCVVLPTQDNDGKPIGAAHTALMAVLIETCGGYSSRTIDGAWKNGRRVYHDHSVEYVALASADAIKTVRQFVVDQLLALSRQKAILLSVRDVRVVEFLDSATPLDGVAERAERGA